MKNKTSTLLAKEYPLPWGMEWDIDQFVQQAIQRRIPAMNENGAWIFHGPSVNPASQQGRKAGFTYVIMDPDKMFFYIGAKTCTPDCNSYKGSGAYLEERFPDRSDWHKHIIKFHKTEDEMYDHECELHMKFDVLEKNAYDKPAGFLNMQIGDVRSPTYGVVQYHHSVIKKKSAAMKGNTIGKGNKNTGGGKVPMSVIFKGVDDPVLYPSVNEMSKDLGITDNGSTVANWFSGHRTAKKTLTRLGVVRIERLTDGKTITS